MANERESIHGQWSSPTIFVLAASGAVIGLGNFWQFPSLVASNGGSAFLLVYLVCLAMIAIPLMMAEVLMGRRGGHSPVGTLRALAREAGRHRSWLIVGVLAVLVGFLLLSYYSVIAGWTLAFMVQSARGAFAERPAQAVAGIFGDLVANPELLLLWHTLFMVMTVWIVSRGVRSGLELAARYLVPALFGVLLLLDGYAMNTSYFEQGLTALFVPDFSKITLNTLLLAMEYSFFTLTLGTGAVMAYGAYLPKGGSIIKTTLAIVIADTIASLLAGMALLPLLLSKGVEPVTGPGLVFQTLPIIFGQITNGTLVGTLFFILLALAAWTTLIALAEPAVAWLVEGFGMTRRKAAWWVGLFAWVLGIAAALSFNLWSVEPYLLFGKTFFYRLDYLTSHIMIPVVSLLLAIFAGWVMRRESVAEELGAGRGLVFRSWQFLVRYVAPVAVLIVFLHAIGVIHFE